MKKALLLTLTSIIASTLFSQELIVIESKNLKCNDSILVFTPKGEVANQSSIPTLFLLHGWSGKYSDWSKKSNLQSYCDKYGFRIICPDGFYNSWYMDNSDSDKMQWRKFFHNELYPTIKERFNLDPDLSFITGLSMGGQGAVNLFIDDTTKFRAAGSMSGVLNLQHTRLKTTEIAKIFGEWSENNTRYDNESATNRLKKIAKCQKNIIVTCGYDDVYAKSAEEFFNEGKKLGNKVILMLSPGNHSWIYWDFALDMHLSIFYKLAHNKNRGY